VIADNCDSKTRKIIGSFNCIKFFSTKNLFIANSRNVGFSLSSGNIISFIDGDCIPLQNWIKEIDKIPKDVDIVFGKRIAPKMPFYDFREIKYQQRSGKYSEKNKRIFDKNNYREMYLISGQNMAMRRKFLSKIMFDSTFNKKGCEDVDIQWRAIELGYKILFNPQMIVFHYHPHSLIDHFKKAIKYGGGERQLEHRNPKILENTWYRAYAPSLLKAVSSLKPKILVTEIVDFVGRMIGRLKS